MSVLDHSYSVVSWFRVRVQSSKYAISGWLPRTMGRSVCAEGTWMGKRESNQINTPVIQPQCEADEETSPIIDDYVEIASFSGVDP